MAVPLGEPEREAFVEMMLDHECRISAASLAGAGIVADRRSRELGRGLDLLVDALDIDVVPVTRHHAQLARIGWDGHRNDLRPRQAITDPADPTPRVCIVGV